MLCRLLLGVRSLQSSHVREATNQEAKELSARKKLSPATTKKLGKDSSCLRVGGRGSIFSFYTLGGGPDFSA